jgi:hypothetical protein
MIDYLNEPNLHDDKPNLPAIIENVTIAKWWDPSSGGNIGDEAINTALTKFVDVLKNDVLQDISDENSTLTFVSIGYLQDLQDLQKSPEKAIRIPP